MREPDAIRAIAFKDGDVWVGQCLEYDIGAQASDLHQLHARLVLAVGAERKTSIKIHGAPFAGIGPAPRHFHDMWERASGNFNPRRPSRTKEDGHVDIEMALCA